METQDGVYCSTSGTVFTDKESLAEHYKSDLHRYNLKRKVAGLPPVTSEWFEARRSHLSSLQQEAADVVYICPLTNKKFQSEGTYENHTRTQKFKASLKKAALVSAPPPRVVPRRTPETARPSESNHGTQITQLQQHLAGLAVRESQTIQESDSNVDDGDSSGWETDSQIDDETLAAAEVVGAASSKVHPGDAQGDAADGDVSSWQEWDVCQSLFDNHVSPSLDDNLKYMYKKFGFFLPDAQYLQDPEGLIKYLGAKLRYGHQPLYSSGLDDQAKRFGSLHAVQRHMIDSNKCTMCYDGNEDEYEDYFDYPEMDESDALALPGVSTDGYELHIQRPGKQGVQVLGCRDFKHVYRQNHRPIEVRQQARRQVLLAYNDMGVPQVTSEEVQKRVQRLKHDKRREWSKMKSQIANDKIYKLPKNCTH
eukprot:jgi/Ulvmu1/239/UM001_0243.1